MRSKIGKLACLIMVSCFDLLIDKSDRQILAELQEKASHPIADMLTSMPDVAEFCRMSGAVYYLLLVAVSDMKAYVWLYRLSKANS